jgi:hypothetical protein
MIRGVVRTFFFQEYAAFSDYYRYITIDEGFSIIRVC